MGLGRFELPTPRLSSVCSDQLSYRPDGVHGPGVRVPSKLDRTQTFWKHAPRDLDRARLDEYQIDLEWTRTPAASADGRVSL